MRRKHEIIREAAAKIAAKSRLPRLGRREMANKADDLRSKYSVFHTQFGGIEALLWGDAGDEVCSRLMEIPSDPLSKVQLNQLLGLQEERAVSDDFFRYYWLEEPAVPYKLSSIPGFASTYGGHTDVRSIEQFFYGMYRIFVDGLLHYGNVRQYFRECCNLNAERLAAISKSSMFDTNSIKQRGPQLPLRSIPKDDRYLISEMACKSYGEAPDVTGALRDGLLAAWNRHHLSGGGQVSVRSLLTGTGLALLSSKRCLSSLQSTFSTLMYPVGGARRGVLKDCN
jgi:hypothetical protein